MSTKTVATDPLAKIQQEEARAKELIEKTRRENENVLARTEEQLKKALEESRQRKLQEGETELEKEKKKIKEWFEAENAKTETDAEHVRTKAASNKTKAIHHVIESFLKYINA